MLLLFFIALFRIFCNYFVYSFQSHHLRVLWYMHDYLSTNFSFGFIVKGCINNVTKYSILELRCIYAIILHKFISFTLFDIVQRSCIEKMMVILSVLSKHSKSISISVFHHICQDSIHILEMIQKQSRAFY